MTSRYQHVPTEVLTGIADQLGDLLWAPPPGEEDNGDGPATALVPAEKGNRDHK